MKELSAYYKERFGFDSITNNRGFISFVVRPPVCVIQDLYVHPEFRKEGAATAFANEVTSRAKKEGCTHIWAEVQSKLKELNPTLSARAVLSYGFEIYESYSDRIVFVKNIEEEKCKQQ